MTVCDNELRRKAEGKKMRSCGRPLLPTVRSIRESVLIDASRSRGPVLDPYAARRKGGICGRARHAESRGKHRMAAAGAIIRSAIFITLLASPTLASSVELEDVIEFAVIGAKLLMVFSPIIAIAAILMLSRESDEEEERKRGIKCAKS